MNTFVADKYHIINVQGIRYVERKQRNVITHTNPDALFLIVVQYKGNYVQFGYKSEHERDEMFEKIRECVIKTREPN